MTPPAEPERPRVVPPRRDWAGLAPLQRTLGTTTLLSSSARFASTLATRSVRPLVQPLTHGVMQDAPAGRLRGVARPDAASLPLVDQSHHEELPLAGEATTAQRPVLQRRVPPVSAPEAATPTLMSAPRPETPERRVRAVQAPVQREMRGTFQPVGSPAPTAQPTSGAAEAPQSDGGDADLPLVGEEPATQAAEAPSDTPVQAEAPTLAAGDRGGATEPVARADSDPVVQPVVHNPAPDAAPLPVARVHRAVDDGEPGESASPSADPESIGSVGLGTPVSRPTGSSSASGSASVQRTTAGDAARPARRRVGLGEPLVRGVQRSATRGAESPKPSSPDAVASSGSEPDAPSGPDEPAADAPTPSDPSSAPLIGERSSPATLAGSEQPPAGGSPAEAGPAGPVVPSGDGGSDLPLQRSAVDAGSPDAVVSRSPGSGPGVSEPVGGDLAAESSSAPLIGERSSPAALGASEEPVPGEAQEASSPLGEAASSPGSVAPSGDGGSDLPLQRSAVDAGSPDAVVSRSPGSGPGVSEPAGGEPVAELSSAPLIGERSSPAALGGAEQPPAEGSPAEAGSAVPSSAGASALPLQRAAGPGSVAEPVLTADGTAPADAPDASATPEDQAGSLVEPASTASGPPTTLAADAGPSIGPMPLQMMSAPLLAHRPPLIQRMLEPDQDVQPGSPAAPSRGAGSGAGSIALPAPMSPTAPMSSTAPSSRLSPSTGGRPAVQRMPVQPLRRVASDLGGATQGRGTPPSASASSTDGATTPSAMPEASGPGDAGSLVSGVPDVDSPSAASGWEGTADVVTPWTPQTSSGFVLHDAGAPAAAGLATLQRTAEGMPAPVPQTVQRLQATVPQRVQGTQAAPAQLWSPATGPAGQIAAPGETSWLAPDATNGELDLAKPAAVPAAGTTALQRDAAVGMPVTQAAAPAMAQPAPVVAQPAPVVAQPVPEVQREEAPTSAPAPASQPPTATLSSQSANAAVGGTTPQTEEELDVLAGRLYDHIAVRLRRELRMDRERTGLLTDLS